MDIDIHNAFLIAVKLSCEPCFKKYRMLTEITLNCSHYLMTFFLRRPIIATISFSLLLLAILSALSIVFILILGVLFLILIILLTEGFVLCLILVFTSLVLFNLFVIVTVFLEIKFKLSNQIQVNV